MDKFTLQNPVFATYAIAAAIKVAGGAGEQPAGARLLDPGVSVCRHAALIIAIYEYTL